MILKPLGHQQVTGLNTVKALTVPLGTQRILLVCTAQNVRFRDDGNNPTATVGIQLVAGTVFRYRGDPSAIKFIEETASAVLEASFYS